MANDAAAVRSRFRVTVNGSDISPAIAPILVSLRTRSARGQAADTASIELDDAAGSLVLPTANARMQIELRDPRGLGLVFDGTVDEVRSRADRSGGRILAISAKGANVLGRAKQIQERHFDDVTVGDALRQAGEAAGISDVRVDPALAGISRSYLAMEGESFLAFGQRLAREVGGSFKMIGDRALLVKRNGGTTVSGRALSVVEARFGHNLLSWDIAPFVSRPRHRRTRARHYDPDAGALKDVAADLQDESTDAELIVRYPAADEGAAQDQASASAAEVEGASGSGTVTIDADTGAQPEGVCSVIGARPGVDGDYRIDAVEHSIDRQGGLTTRLDLGQPHGQAGSDARRKKQPEQLQTLSF